MTNFSHKIVCMIMHSTGKHQKDEQASGRKTDISLMHVVDQINRPKSTYESLRRVENPDWYSTGSILERQAISTSLK